MVGLLASEVRESKERVRTALKNSGVSLPIGRITVSLSPANIRKEGSGFDLPIAISLLCNMEMIDYDFFKEFIILGELGLDGEVKPVRGVLPIVNMARKKGYTKFIISDRSIKEAVVFDDIEIMPIGHINELLEKTEYNNILLKSKECREENYEFNDATNINIINGDRKKENNKNFTLEINNENEYKNNKETEDFSDIVGQESVKRAIMIATAGWHNLLMIGAPGVGKSMLASRIPTIIPKMTLEESIEVSEIHSICGLLDEEGLVKRRPFSAPHHSITNSALIGGGNNPKPGEITIAHKGVLFLDELPEFNPNILNSLRQPMEEKMVKIVRNSGAFVFPADCLIVAAMNPCKCGYYPDRSRCTCSEQDVKRYISRINGPILDRIDMEIEVSRIDNPIELSKSIKNDEYKNCLNYNNEDMNINNSVNCEDIDKNKITSSKQMSEIISKAIEIQLKRQEGKMNGRLNSAEVREYCVLDKDSAEFMKQVYDKFNLSIRGYYKIVRVARTIADIEESENIKIEHLMEATAYRISNSLK